MVLVRTTQYDTQQGEVELGIGMVVRPPFLEILIALRRIGLYCLAQTDVVLQQN